MFETLELGKKRFPESQTSPSQLRNIVVLGASDKPERYGYIAFRRLKDEGFAVIPVNPRVSEIDGVRVLPSLSAIDTAQSKIDTLTVYLSEKRSTPLADEIAALAPGRVILNPGAENENLRVKLEHAGIPVHEACTLVLLNTGRF